MSSPAVPFIGGLGSCSAQERLAECGWAGGAFSSSAASNFTLTLAQLLTNGTNFLTLTANGANAVTTPTALQIVTQLTQLLGFQAPVGFTFQFEISNQGNGIVTLTAGTGVTITGTATVAATSNRTWLVTVTDNRSASAAVTFQNIGGRNN